MRSPYHDVRVHACMHVTTSLGGLPRRGGARRRTGDYEKGKKKGKGKKGGEEKKSSKSELISPLLSGPFFPTEDVRRHAHQSNNRPRYRGEPVSEYSSIGIERGGIRRFRKESTTYCRVDSYYARKGGRTRRISKNSHEDNNL